MFKWVSDATGRLLEKVGCKRNEKTGFVCAFVLACFSAVVFYSNGGASTKTTNSTDDNNSTTEKEDEKRRRR